MSTQVPYPQAGRGCPERLSAHALRELVASIDPFARMTFPTNQAGNVQPDRNEAARWLSAMLRKLRDGFDLFVRIFRGKPVCEQVELCPVAEQQTSKTFSGRV